MTDAVVEKKVFKPSLEEHKLFAGLARQSDGQGEDGSGFAIYIPGTLPIVISVPHGGYGKPVDALDRKSGVFDNDVLTQELADAIQLEFNARFRRIPHLIVNRLHRRKLDANRNIDDAAQGSAPAETAWRFFQTSIETAKAEIIKQYKRGFHMDLHGQSHDKRIQLGYLVRGADMDKTSDKELDASPAAFRDKSSIRTLATRYESSGASSSSSSSSTSSGDGKTAYVTFSSLFRGADSLGALFEARGYPAVPSPQNPTTKGVQYFNGGYNTLRHGSQSGGQIDSIQAELANQGLRDTPENRTLFSRAYCDCLVAYLKRHYFPGEEGEKIFELRKDYKPAAAADASSADDRESKAAASS